jgi:glycosyltransferase involved in cell wall biosynthesis
VGRQLAHATAPGRPRVVSAGYWAPYKGIDLFLETARRERNGADFFLVGQPHAGLNSDHGFRELVARWRKVANEIPVATPGFLEGPALDRLLSGRTIGVLPYTSVSGASASFRLFSERGVPVVASDLPEFRYLQEQGAGLVLVPPAADAIGEAVRRLILEPRAYEDLISRQLDFSARTSWPPFVSSLLGPKPDF